MMANLPDSYDPVAETPHDPDAETPFLVIPRGGAREVGRSCYQIETEHTTLLVDCGLNQGSGGQFPDFRGLEPGDVDAVILTHAHIDHCGGLPVLENQGLLDADAPILLTQPTAQLADTMLLDSLKIHQRECRAGGRQQRFTREDINAVTERFTPIGYQTVPLADYAPAPQSDRLTLQLGNAAHLLGSAWVAIQQDGYRAVFSGDLGGRATHLPDLEAPPEADALIIESTYGDTHSHRSFTDAQSDLFRAVEQAVATGEPLLIPTFAVGRAQLIMRTLRNRLRSRGGTIEEDAQLVLDGLATDATDIYRNHIRDADYISESIVNEVENSDRTDVFLPDGVLRPAGDDDRRRVFDQFDYDRGENVPIIVAPSGMLTGGNSPRYLLEMAARYESARVLLTGYQAVGTNGRALSQAEKVDGGEDPVLTLEVDPIGSPGEWPAAHDGRVGWIRPDDNPGGDPLPQVTIPVGWVSRVNGLSGHAAQHGLLSFARDIQPETIGLVHGPEYAQQGLQNHLAENVASVEQTTRLGLFSPIALNRDTPDDISTPVEVGDQSDDDDVTLGDQVDDLNETVLMLGTEVAALRNGPVDEEAVRRIAREELSGADESATDADGAAPSTELRDDIRALRGEIETLRGELGNIRDDIPSQADQRAIVRDELQRLVSDATDGATQDHPATSTGDD
jgi:Cft2 family RNA processing exonuclease